ncbi:hypothetical protein BLA6992_05617 [Burkholderia lata]|nr:hypothetical protein BLA6992_05617 [Burkholderia lata]
MSTVRDAFFSTFGSEKRIAPDSGSRSGIRAAFAKNQPAGTSS